MKYIKKLSTIATATGLGAILITGLTGCMGEQQQQQEQTQEKKGAFVIIEETAPGKYKIKDEFPADETRIVLKQLNGKERVLTQEEMDKLVKEEAAKIDNGTSTLTQQNPEVSEGMGLGSVLLSSIAGAMIGSWIGNKLFGNQNFQNNRRASYKSASTYSRSSKSFSNTRRATSSSSTKRSGFFSNRKSSSRSHSSFGG